MWMARRHPDRDHLGDYWNALNRGAPPGELARLAAPLDPRMLAAIDRAQALHRRRRPDPAFADRLERTLMDAFASSPAGTVPLRPTPTGRSNGRTVPSDRPGWLPSLPATGKRARWLVAQVATVALIVLAVVGGILVFNNNDRPAVNPPLAPSATPAATEAVDVPMYRGNAARTGEMPGSGPSGEPIELWRAQTQGEIHSAAAVVGGTLYVGSNDNNLYALNAATGDEIWRFATTGSVSSSPAVVDGIVYVASADENIYAIDAATGTERWRVAGARDNAAPAVVDGVVYIGSIDGTVLALDATTGTDIWRTNLNVAVSRSAAVAGGLVYIGTEDGIFHALDAATGEERWSFDTGLDRVLTPSIADGIVYFIGFATDGSQAVLIAADAVGGEERWRYTTPSGGGMTPVAVTDGLVVVGIFDGDVAAVDAESGEERWYYDTGSEDVLNSAVAVTSDTVYAAGLDGNLHAIDLATGFERWRYAVGAAMDLGPVVTGGVLYVGAHDGIVYALGDSGAASSLTLPAATGDATPGATAVGSPAATPAGSVSAPLEFAGGIGDDQEPLGGPSGLAFDADGRLYVIDSLNDRIRIFDRDGAPVASWGETGIGPGQFRFHLSDTYHGDLAIDRDGSVYVSDLLNDRIQKFAPDGTFILMWGSTGMEQGQFNEPTGIALDAEGRVYVADYPNGTVQIFDGDGRFLEAWGGSGGKEGPLQGPNDVAIGADGTVYVTDDKAGQVHRFDAAGTHLGSFGEPGTGAGQFVLPWGLTVDAAGYIYVVDPTARKLHVLAPDGTFIGSWSGRDLGIDEFQLPIYVALDADGYLYVADQEFTSVQKFRLLPPLGPAATLVA